MALTAARTELNVSLVGEDETIRMLEDAKKRMGELEAKTRTLTGATKAQTDAAKAQQAATSGLNDTLGRMGGAIAGPVEGIGRLKEGINKYIEIFGFLGMAINGAIAAFNFLSDAFDDNAKEAEKSKEAMKKMSAAAEETRKEVEALATAQQKSIEGKRTAESSLISEQLRLAKLEKDAEAEAALSAKLEHQNQMNRVAELREQIQAKTAEEIAADNVVRESNRTQERFEREQRELTAEANRLDIIAQEKKRELQELTSQASESAGSRAIQLAEELQEAEAKANLLRIEAVSITTNILTPEKQRAKVAEQNVKALREQKSVLQDMFDIAGRVGDALKKAMSSDVLQMDVLDESGAAKKRAGGGGGRGKTKAEREREQREKAYERFKIIRDLNEEEDAIERAKQRQLAKSALGDEVVAAQKTMKERILRELESLPTDATSKAFQPLRAELEKQLAEIEKVTAQHAEMGFWGLPDYFDADIVNKVIDSWEAESQGIAKVDAALGKLGETRAKAIEEADKMREAMMRAMPADVVNNFTTGLEQLSQIQAPVFEAVQESLAGVAAQMGKFKEGQTSLTAAIVGSASAIAGAVAKKVGGVKAEAGVRAAFEVAMGIATAFTNPAESVGHFAAATAFGLLAGGVIKPSGGGASGGQKAPAASAAATREGTMGGGGGTITNVYNLQTGIIDGQSTAMAFRRAEMTARNTGMASAGGW